jgi:hypothetical protein
MKFSPVVFLTILEKAVNAAPTGNCAKFQANCAAKGKFVGLVDDSVGTSSDVGSTCISPADMDPENFYSNHPKEKRDHYLLNGEPLHCAGCAEEGNEDCILEIIGNCDPFLPEEINSGFLALCHQEPGVVWLSLWDNFSNPKYVCENIYGFVEGQYRMLWGGTCGTKCGFCEK